MRDMPDSLKSFVAKLDERPEAMLITDRAGNVLWISRSFAELTGYEPEDVMGCAPGFRPFGEHTGRSCAGFWRSVLALETWTGEVGNRRKDDSCFRSSLTVTPVADASGRLGYLLCAYTAADDPGNSGLRALLEAVASQVTEPANRET